MAYYNFFSDIVTLDIGGTRFEILEDTVKKSEFFAKVLKDRKDRRIKQSDGSVFIDRDPFHFRHILNYLRNDRVPQFLSKTDIEQLTEEANFYQLTDMIELLNPKDTEQEGGHSRVQKTTRRRRRLRN